MKMKKLTSVLLVAACALSLVACGGSGDKKDSSKGGSSSKTAKVIDIDLTNEEYAFGVDKTQPELLEKTNAFIEKIKGDGTLDKICDKYFGSGEPEAVESAKLDSSKDQLVVATNAAFEPFEYTMAGLTINEEREEYVTFTDSYYSASQRLIVPSDNTTFDDCKSADDVAALLAKTEKSDKIGVQAGTTGQYYVEGSEDWDFPGLPAECVTYKSGSLAVQDMLNGNITYVIIDAAPASAITESINEMQ